MGFAGGGQQALGAFQLPLLWHERMSRGRVQHCLLRVLCCTEGRRLATGRSTTQNNQLAHVVPEGQEDSSSAYKVITIRFRQQPVGRDRAAHGGEKGATRRSCAAKPGFGVWPALDAALMTENSS